MEQLVIAVAGAAAVWLLQRLGILPATAPAKPPISPVPGPAGPGVPTLPATGNPVFDLILQALLKRLHGEMEAAAVGVAERVLPPVETPAPPTQARQP